MCVISTRMMYIIVSEVGPLIIVTNLLLGGGGGGIASNAAFIINFVPCKEALTL